MIYLVNLYSQPNLSPNPSFQLPFVSSLDESYVCVIKVCSFQRNALYVTAKKYMSRFKVHTKTIFFFLLCKSMQAFEPF